MAKLGEYADRLENMSYQEILEVGATHLLEQGVKSETQESSGCLYNGPGDLCCAAAPFIKNYKESMEERTWGDVCHTDRGQSIISHLQSTHDIREPHRWYRAIKDGFSEYDLSFMDNINIHPNCKIQELSK